MAPSRRAALAVVVATVVMVALVVVVSVVTAHQPARLNERNLVLGGRPPTSASLSISIGVGSVNDITGHVDVDFATGSVAGTIDIPEIISTEVASFILVPGTLYLSVPNLISATRTLWVAIPTTATDHGLRGLARELEDARSNLANPARALGTRSSRRSGAFTTFHFRNPTAHIADPANVPVRLPAVVDLTTSITVGSEGQFAAGTVSVSAPHVSDTIAVTVDSYDDPISITAPPTRLVSPVTNALRQRVLGTTTGWLNRLLSPAGIASLFSIRVT